MMRTIVITAGRGPVECRRAVKAVASAFIAEAEEIGLDVDFVPGDDPDGEGPSSARLLLDDDGLDTGPFLRGWLGTVQWIARSERRSKADRKNWFVGVFEEPSTPGDRPRIDEADIAFAAITAGGPGGQHQNKTASAIRATHRPSGVSIVVRAERSQHRNKAMAIERIAAVLDTVRRMEQSRVERTAWELKVEVQRGGAVRVIKG